MLDTSADCKTLSLRFYEKIKGLFKTIANSITCVQWEKNRNSRDSWAELYG